MTPREELRTTGRLGEMGALLLYETMRLVVLAYRFPPPDGHGFWTEADLQATAHDFLQGERGARRLLSVANSSVDDRSFANLLARAARNFLREEGRRTEIGKLIVRIKSVLRAEEEFVEIPQSGEALWTIKGGTTAPSSTPSPELASVSHRVEIVVPNWTSKTRDAPLADHDSFVRLIRAVLEAAAGSLRAGDIAHALAARLNLRRPPLTLDLDAGAAYSEVASTAPDPASITVSSMAATEIFNALSDRERIIVLTADGNVRDLGALIGTGKTQAAHLRQRLLDRIANELEDDEQPEETVSALVGLCENWMRDRTGSTDATSK
ncbi:hypothetical protein ASD11_14950 [Aeromicrobium sp. Root495]|uniref:hypothetical protein n=1 Tax=Aeromicrobium sp. Root495 TaxID=1736550 RepID=UPI00070019F0|nr:hypothetical protein [Aeromicrobium sp. Root495]KQY55800.1 hypothetical protein ASD11_14950 [Aeromicrobium sp. Root495]